MECSRGGAGPYPLVQEIVDRHLEALDLGAELQAMRDYLPEVNLKRALGTAAGLASGVGVVRLSDWIASASQAGGSGGL